MPIIDIHMHTARAATITRANGETYATPRQLLNIMDRAGIDRAVLLPSVSPECAHHITSTEDVLDICDQYKRFIPFCNIDPRFDTNSAEADLRRFLAYYVDRGCVGLGEVTANLPFDDPRVENLFAACQAIGIPVVFHIAPAVGGYYGLYDEPGLPRLERALERFPELTFLGHSQPFWAEMGPDYGQAGRNGYPEGPVAEGGRLPTLFARYPNLCGDLSANSGYNAVTRDRAFGCQFMETYRERLFFATDICAPSNDTPLVRYLKACRESGALSSDAYERITWRNADALLHLGLS